MRKLVLSVVACCALIAIVPASALAHRHHHHKRHHSRIHHRTFGHDWSQSGSSTTSTSSDQNAGTVQSFTGGVLTIALTNGQTVSGAVTGDTQIECQGTETSSTWSSHDHGGDNGGDQGDDQGQGDDDNNGAQSCDMSSLTPGTAVHEARMSVSGGGASWDKVELVTQSSGSSQSSGSWDS